MTREVRLMARNGRTHSPERRAPYDPFYVVNPYQMKTKLYACKRLVLCIFVLICAGSMAFTQQVAKTIPYAGSPTGIIGFLQFTPPDYGTQKHPLIIFMHGIGERGNGTTQIQSITANGIARYCAAAGTTMKFTVNGQTSSFVVLSPQLDGSLGQWPTWYAKELIKYAKANPSNRYQPDICYRPQPWRRGHLGLRL